MPNLGRGEGIRIVGKYMRQSPGIQIHYKDVAGDTGLTTEQVNNTLGTMSRAGTYGIFRVKQGVYVYYPDKAQTAQEPEPKREGPELFEFVGIIKSGDRIVKDEKGVLWKITTEL